MRLRKSIRSFDPTPISLEIVDRINFFVETNTFSPFQGKTRFELIQLKRVEQRIKKKFGTYGFIQGANSFLVGIIKKNSTYDLEHIGFVFEKIILYITQLNLGTCWLGGTFKRGKLMAYLNLDEGEYIPAITPIGIPALIQNKRSQLIRKVARSDNRKIWSELFFDVNTLNPLILSKDNEYFIPLEMVRYSPSASNHQPWRVVKSDNESVFNFYICREKPFFHKRFSFPDFQRIDLGIATSHFDLACQEMGLPGKWVINNPELDVPMNFQYLISWKGD
ncbi:MAG: nitroreductase family protein [Candidatus Hodarchaeales archaeon]